MAEEELKPRFRKDGGNQGFATRAWNCPKDEAIAAYVDGNVDASERSRVESHLAGCALSRPCCGRGENEKRFAGHSTASESKGSGARNTKIEKVAMDPVATLRQERRAR
jgi:anti-sigma factor RsiW